MTQRHHAPGPLVVVGDALLDRDLVGRAERLSPDAPVPVVSSIDPRPRPGGAALAALLAAQDGREVVLVTALAEDAAGQELRRLLEPHLSVLAVPLAGPTTEKVRVRVGDQSLLRLDYGDQSEPGPLPERALAAVAAAPALLVSDYGRGLLADTRLRHTLARRAHEVPVVWDPHPRSGPPVPGVRLATPNDEESRHFAGRQGRAGQPGLAGAAARAATLVRDWQAQAVAVTLGARGALLSFGEEPPVVAPAPRVTAVDVCGAGDRFAAAAAGLLADGALPSEAVLGAVTAAGAFLAAGGAAAVRPAEPLDRPPRRERVEEVLARVRSAGGSVVATGGCFDLLHAGHVSTLEAARGLGDALVVLLNSDASVRRLKGESRPLVPQADRARVLAALECVDAVVVFDEDTPERALEWLRPDIWAKGGDYTGAQLPEAELVRSWGGQTVLLPYLDGRSTTGLLQRAVEGSGP